MKQLFPLVIAGLLLSTGPTHAQSGFWRDGGGKPVADTESRKSKDGFAGALLATTDEDWQKKWNTPPETKPQFTEAGTVPYGRKVFVLTFFANPQLDKQGRADIRCDLQVTSPAGKVASSQKDMECFSGQIKGSPHNMYLSAPIVTFRGDPGDLPGTWSVEVVLRDMGRGTELPLRTSFELK